MVGVGKINMLDEYESVLNCDMDLNKKVIKLRELNELACKDLISSINTNSSVGK